MRLSLYMFLSSFLCHGRHLSLLEHCLHHKCQGHSFLSGNVANAHACTPPSLNPAHLSCSCVLCSDCQAHCLFLHTVVLRLIRSQGSCCGWLRDTGNCVLHHLCHLLPCPQGGLSQAHHVPPFPLFYSRPLNSEGSISYLWLYFPFIFILFPSLLSCAPKPWGESLLDLPLSLCDIGESPA